MKDTVILKRLNNRNTKLIVQEGHQNKNTNFKLIWYHNVVEKPQGHTKVLLQTMTSKYYLFSYNASKGRNQYFKRNP